MRDIVVGHVEKRYIQPGLVIAITKLSDSIRVLLHVD